MTHNDTMLNNVLFDRTSRKAVCVVDLDTVMPGLSAYDFGDSIRFGANLAAEDEVDASKAGLDLEMYQAYLRGYLETCPSLTAQELKRLPDGARLMTLECGLRVPDGLSPGRSLFRNNPARPESGPLPDPDGPGAGYGEPVGRHGGGPVRRKEPCV